MTVKRMTVTDFIEKKAKNGNAYKIFTPDGDTENRLTVFDKLADNLVMGGVYDVTTEKGANGRTNITEMKLISTAEAVIPTDTARPAKRSNSDTDSSIESQVAIKEVGMALRDSIYKEEAVVKIPEAIITLYWEWIEKRLTPRSIGSLVKAVEDMGGIKQIETAGEFMTICMETWGMGRTEVERALGRPLTSVKDYTKALIFIRDAQNEPKQEALFNG